MPAPIFKRILLKISGEALAADKGFGVDTIRIHEVAAELADVHQLGIQMAIVVGGGNFFRGVADQARNMDRVSADHMGMLATVINALGVAGRAGKTECLHPRADGDRDEPGGRAVHPAARYAAPGKRTRRDFRRRHWQPIFLDRHGGVAARHGNQGGCDS